MTEATPPLLPKIIYWFAVVVTGLWAAFILQKWIDIDGFALPASLGGTNEATIRISLLVSAPIAMFVALLLRSGAVVWIYALHFGQNILPFLLASRIPSSPKDAFFSILSFHPALIALQIGVLIYLVYTNQVRRP